MDVGDLIKRRRRRGEGTVRKKKQAAIRKVGAATLLMQKSGEQGNKGEGRGDEKGQPTQTAQSRKNFTLRLGQIKKEDGAGSKDEAEPIPEDDHILWDSTSSLETKKKMKRWVEDAMETDSLMLEKLKKIWPNVEVMVCRKEEDYVDRELRKVNSEIPVIGELYKVLKDFYGTGVEGSGEAEKDVEAWNEKVELPPRMRKLDGGLNRNELSLYLLNAQKEGQSLTRKLLPAHKKRKSTLGFVSKMMFTKRIGMAWKVATKEKVGGDSDMEALKRAVGELAKKKQKLEIEVLRLKEK